MLSKTQEAIGTYYNFSKSKGRVKATVICLIEDDMFCCEKDYSKIDMSQEVLHNWVLTLTKTRCRQVLGWDIGQGSVQFFLFEQSLSLEAGPSQLHSKYV